MVAYACMLDLVKSKYDMSYIPEGVFKEGGIVNYYDENNSRTC
jgi:hypothetical protein